MSRKRNFGAGFLFSSALAVSLFWSPSVHAQNNRWIGQFGSTAPFQDEAYGVSSDGGNVYVVGSTAGALSGEVNAGSTDGIIRKYNSTGGVLWFDQFGSSNSDAAYGVIADPSGAYVVGTVGGNLNGQTGLGLSNGFITRYDPNGNVLWTRLISVPGAFTNAFAVAADAGGIYVAGATTGVVIGSNAGSQDVFVRKYDASGNAIWSVQFGTSQDDQARAVAVNSSGVFVMGTTGGALPGQVSAGFIDAFVRKLDANGNTVWTRQFGSASVDLLEGGAADSSGVYAGGATGGVLGGAFLGGTFDAYVRKFDNDGNVQWTRQFGSSGSDAVEGVAVDGTGVYAGGHTDGTLTGQSSAGGSDLLIQKFDLGGNNVFTRQFGSSAADFTHDVTVDATGAILAGTTLGSLPGASQGNAGLGDGFVAALTNSGGGGGGGSQLRFVPVVPCRIGDTRIAGGVFGAPSFAAQQTRDVPIPSSVCGIPASARAYSLNVTVVPIEPLAFLTAWPSGQNRPDVSTLNSFHGGVVANAAIVPAGANGSISIYATNRTDVIVDINGYFDVTSAPNSYAFFTTTPCRVADTRNGQGFTGSFGPPAMVANGTRNFPISSGACSVPAAGAYSLSATVVPANQLGFLTLWSAGAGQPNVSTLNSFDGAIVSNAAIVPASAGSISALASNQTDLILDINGYFGTPGIIGELYFNPITPCRLADTRNPGNSIMAAQETRNFTAAGACGVPGDARAFSMNVTVVPPAPLSFLTLWPAGQVKPFVSTLNSFLGRIVANAAIVPAGANGQVSVFTTDASHVILDINGYFR